MGRLFVKLFSYFSAFSDLPFLFLLSTFPFGMKGGKLGSINQSIRGVRDQLACHLDSMDVREDPTIYTTQLLSCVDNKESAVRRWGEILE
jgi:hypothetical protein